MSALTVEAPGSSETAASQIEEEHSYGQILKSSAWIGGSTMLNIGIGIVRTKAMAVLLGPAGFGVSSLYSSLAELAQSIAGMGLNSSGVRQIAEATGTGSRERIAVTAIVLRRVSLVLGIIGALALALFAKPIAKITFGSSANTAGVALLALVVFCKLVSNGQSALLQGMRRIADLAKVSVFGAAAGTAAAIPLVYFLRIDGIVPALIAVAAAACLSSWWYSRRVPIASCKVPMADVASESAALLKLGFAFMASGFFVIGAAYVIRILLLRESGATATGYYQSAWTLGGLYVGIILQAMGADFYPRLTAQANNHSIVNRLTNEQTHVGLLLAGPGVIATLAFAPAVLGAFYSAKFYAAADILRWIALGTLMQVVSWPMGFIILAKGRQNLFLASDLAFTSVYLGLAWFLIHAFGLQGAGMAFFAAYAFHTVLNYLIARRLSGFRWSNITRLSGMVLLAMAGAVFVSFSVLPTGYALATGAAALIATGIYSLRTLLRCMPETHLPPRVRRLLMFCARGTR